MIFIFAFLNKWNSSGRLQFPFVSDKLLIILKQMTFDQYMEQQQQI